MDIRDMEARSEAGNKHLLFIGDRASKLLLAYLLPNETAENVTKKLLELLLTFGIPLYLRSDPGTDFTAEVVQHLCKWFNVPIDYGPSDHSRAPGAVARLESFNDWGGRGCRKFVPVLKGDGTKIAPPGDIFGQPSGEMS